MSEASTATLAVTGGSTWRRRMRASLAPSTVAASTSSLCRTARVALRTTRAKRL